MRKKDITKKIVTAQKSGKHPWRVFDRETEKGRDELVLKPDSSCHYTFTTKRGTKFSVVDFKEFMKKDKANFKLMKAAGVFMGWEALPLKYGTGDIFRAPSWNSLLKYLEDL